MNEIKLFIEDVYNKCSEDIVFSDLRDRTISNNNLLPRFWSSNPSLSSHNPSMILSMIIEKQKALETSLMMGKIGISSGSLLGDTRIHLLNDLENQISFIFDRWNN